MKNCGQNLGGRLLRAPYAHPAELGRRTRSITYAMPLHVSTGPTETMTFVKLEGFRNLIVPSPDEVLCSVSG